MGGQLTSQLNIFTIGEIPKKINVEILDQMFPIIKKDEKKELNYDYTIKNTKADSDNFKIEWKNYVFNKEIDEEFAYNLCQFIKNKAIKASEIKDKNNVILCFKENKILLEKIELLRKECFLAAPIVIIVDSVKKGKNTEKLDYVNYIPFNFLSQNTNELSNQIKSKLFKIDSYYYGRGTNFNTPSIQKFTESNLESSTTLNIFLAGEARVGKSTFVNILMDELCARESPDFEAVTMNCAEYIVPLRGIKVGKKTTNIGRIKLIDSPGFDSKDRIKMVKNSIDDYLEKEVKSGENIHCILYFIRAGTSFTEEKVEFLRYIIKKKIKIFFILNFSFNPNDYQWKNSLASFITNKFPNEYQEILGENNENIILVNIKEMDFGNENKIEPYGIDEIFKKILNHIRPKKFTREFFQQLKGKSFDEQLAIVKKNYEYLFQNINSIHDLSDGAKTKSQLIIWSSTSLSGAFGLIPIPFADVLPVIAINTAMCDSIGKVYKFKPGRDYNLIKLVLSDGKNLGYQQNGKTEEFNLVSRQIKKDAAKGAMMLGGKIVKEAAEEIVDTSIKYAAVVVVEEAAYEVVEVGSKQIIVEVVETSVEEAVVEITKQGVKAGAKNESLGNVAKLVPVIGQAIGMAVGFAINSISTKIIGNRTLENFEKKFLEEVAYYYFPQTLLEWSSIFKQLEYISSYGLKENEEFLPEDESIKKSIVINYNINEKINKTDNNLMNEEVRKKSEVNEFLSLKNEEINEQIDAFLAFEKNKQNSINKELVQKFRKEFNLSEDDYDDFYLSNILKAEGGDLYKSFEHLFN